MFKKCFMIILLVLLIFLLPSVAFGQEKQEEEKTKFGVGLQGTFPAWGMSVVMDVDDIKSVQGVIGLFGDLKTYTARGIYNFRKESRWKSYGYGMIGAWSYRYQSSLVYEWLSQEWTYREKTETIMSFGAGFGIEYDWWKWDWAPEDLPPICVNVELGLVIGDFKKANYDFSSITLGCGIHYRF